MKKICVALVIITVMTICLTMSTSANEYSGAYNIYIKDSYVFGLPERVASSEFRKSLKQPIEVTGKNGENISDNTYIGTGMTANIKGTEYTFIVSGDLDGDGYVSATDYLRIKSACLNLIELTPIEFEAAECDADGSIGTTDYLRIKSFFLGIYNLFSNSYINGDESMEISNDSEVSEENNIIMYSTFENVNEMGDLNNWMKEVETNASTTTGVAISPYLTAKVNGVSVPVYCARATFSIHSFFSIDVKEGEAIDLNIELQLKSPKNTVTVLPQSSCVNALLTNSVKVNAKITQVGSYSFVFDEDHNEAVTISVGIEETLSVPANYTIEKIKPGYHHAEETRFGKDKTVYYFEPGVHQIESVVVPGNSIIYVDRNAYIYAENSEYYGTFECTSNGTFEMIGRGIIDFSHRERLADSLGFSFSNIDGFRMTGLTIINSFSWTVCLVCCKNIEISNLIEIAYRTFSDGIMLSNCTEANVHHCFIRTGDDAAEIKTCAANAPASNVVFSDMAVWTDKGCGYGVIYENNSDTSGIRFERCSIGFALPNWSDHLGCLNIHAGANSSTVISDITFEDIEVYYSKCALLSVVAAAGTIDNITVKNLKNVNMLYNYPVYIRIDKATGCSVGKINLENVNYNGRKLKKNNIGTRIFIKAPEGYTFDKSNITVS